MDLTQIRYFLALARTRNFTRAAEECNVTQPAFSRAIQKLEDELGGSLLLRERALTQLTELGRTMLPLLQQTHDAAEGARRRALELRRGDARAPLRLGIATEVALEPCMPLLSEVVARVEGLELSLRRGPEGTLAEALLAGGIDIALLPDGPGLPERLSRWPLWTEALVLLVPDGHAMAGGTAALSAETLAGHALLLPPGGGVHRAVAGLAGGGPEGGAEGGPIAPHGADAPAEVAALVRLGLGPALLPASTPRPAGSVVRALPPGTGFGVVLAVVAGRPMNRAVGAFSRLARARDWGHAPPAEGVG